MYDEKLYKYDKTKRMEDANLLDGAYLYRLTSLSHNGIGDVLNGRGPVSNPSFGRFHGPNQMASYCSNNILVCFSEVLFHNYHRVLKRVEENAPYADVCSTIEDKRNLIIVKVREIKDLVFIDSNSVRINYDKRITGTMAVNPNTLYSPFRDLSDSIRMNRRRGVIYPSARHSEDFCIALFNDETSRIIPHSYYKLTVKLKLIHEKQKPNEELATIDPYEDKLHSTMAHYEIKDENEYDKLKNSGCINPNNIPPKGMIDFVRRTYVSYPNDAVL